MTAGSPVRIDAALAGVSWPCELRTPSAKELLRVHRDWPPLRSKDDPAAAWGWSDLAKGAADRFALFDPEGVVLGLWAAQKPIIQLEGRFLYRLDFIEVHPARGGLGLGAVLLAAVCYRARELGVEAVVLASFRNKVGFYRKLKATQRKPKGWTCSPSLVPFVIEGETFHALNSKFDAVRVDEENDS